MWSKLSLQSRDNSRVSFTVRFKKGLLLLNFCCSFFFLPVVPIFSLLFCFLQITISSSSCASPAEVTHSFFFFSLFLPFLSCSYLISPVLSFTVSSFGICWSFVCFLFVWGFFPLLLLMLFQLVKKKKIQSMFCLCSFFLTWFFSFCLFFHLLFQKSSFSNFFFKFKLVSIIKTSITCYFSLAYLKGKSST